MKLGMSLSYWRCERAFCWLMQELAKAHASVPNVPELGSVLAALLPVPASHGSFGVLLSNGQALWAHGSTQLYSLQRRHPFSAATLADEDLSVDFAAMTTPNDRVALVATEPLTNDQRRAVAGFRGWSAARVLRRRVARRLRAAVTDVPIPRFDKSYRHAELSRLLRDDAAARRTWCACRRWARAGRGTTSGSSC